MNTFKVSAVALATTIALVGCGGSKKSSSDDKPKVYTSETCMDQTDIINAEIDLTGVTLVSTCLNKESKKDHLILETNKDWKASLKLSNEVNASGMAKGLITFYKQNPIEAEIAINSAFADSDTQQRINDLLKKGDRKELTKVILKDKKALKVFFVDNSATDGKFINESSRMDYSLNFSFSKPGKHSSLVRKLHFVDKKVDRSVKNEETRILMAAMYQPRNENYSFLIMDPTAEKKDDKQPEKKDDKQPEKKDDKQPAKKDGK